MGVSTLGNVNKHHYKQGVLQPKAPFTLGNDTLDTKVQRYMDTKVQVDIKFVTLLPHQLAKPQQACHRFLHIHHLITPTSDITTPCLILASPQIAWAAIAI